MKKNSFLRWVFPVGGLCAACAGALIVTLPKESRPRLHVPMSCSSLTSMLLSEVSITPTTLAAMGATQQEVSTIVGAARALCEGEGGAFGQAHVACEQATEHLNELESRASRGGLGSEGLAQLEAARDAAAGCRSERAQILSQVESVVSSTLDQEQRAIWANIKAAKHVEVPIAQKVVSRTEAQWITVRDRLAEDRTQANIPGSTHQAAETDFEVQVSEAAIEQHLGSVREAWNQAIGQQ